MSCRHNVWFLLSVVLVANSASALPATNRHRVKVLVTTFDPFDGSETNGSQFVGEALRKNAKFGDFDVEICNLPVEFENASRRARACFERSVPKPDLVVSLGENGCALSLETRANNLRDSGSDGADAKGRAPRSELIAKGGPESVTMTLPVGDMYCALPEILKPNVRLSVSPGFFVCNEVAYGFARYLKGKNVPYSFFHVPSQKRCEGPEPPSRTADKLATMLKAAVHSLRARVPSFARALEGCDCISKTQAARNDLLKVATRACRDEVERTLATRLRQFNQED